MPPKLSATSYIDSNDIVVTNINAIERISDVDKDLVLASRKEQDRALAEYKKLFPLVEGKRFTTRGKASDQANLTAPRGGPSGSKGAGILVRPADGSTLGTRRREKNAVVLPGGSVEPLPSDVKSSGDVSKGTIPVGHQSTAGEETAEETSSGESSETDDDGVDQWISYNIEKSEISARADRVKDSKNKIKSSKIPGPIHKASIDNFDSIMEALGRISNRLEDSDRRYESLREDLFKQVNVSNQFPAHPGSESVVRQVQGAPEFPRGSSLRGAYNYTQRAKNHNSDKLTHEEDEVYEDFESNSQIRSDDVGDQDDHDEISLDDNHDGYVCSNLKNFQSIKFYFQKFF